MEDEGDEREQDDYMKTRDVILRNYQVRLLEKAKMENVILYLPSGSGKTLIALHLLCQGGCNIKRSLNEGGKRAFFVSTTKVLVHQLGLVLRTHTKFRVICLTGDANVDSWNREKWMSVIEDNHVLVLTGEILRHILQVQFIKPSEIHLIVFDECHHAVHNHPYKLILNFLKSQDDPETPRILGLTAVLLNSKPKTEVALDIKALESLFSGMVVTEAHTKELLSFSAHPKESIIIYPVATITSKLEEILGFYDSVISVMREMVINNQVSSPKHDGGEDFKNRNKAKRIKNAFENSKRYLVELGVFGGSLSALFYIIFLEKFRLMSKNQNEIAALVYAVTQFNKIRHLLQGIMGEEENEKTIRRFSSPKVLKLIDIVEEVSRSANGKRISIIIFVYERVTAIVLAFLFKRLSAVETKFNPIKADFVVGSSLLSKETLGLEYKNEEILKRFAVGSINLLVATNILEEGIDISACNIVISFDFPKLYPSYFQSKGRARDNESTYYVFISEDEKEKKMFALQGYSSLEKELRKRVSESPEFGENETSQQEVETINLSGKSGTFTVDALTAIKAVDRYCFKLPQDRFSLLSCNAWYKTSGVFKKGFIQLPVNCPIVEVIEGESRPSKKEAKRSVYLVTLKRLHEMGELDDYLDVTTFESKPCFSSLFPHYKNESIDESLPQPGTRRRKQMHKLKFSESLSNCLPLPGAKAYMHVFDLNVVFGKPELERKIAIYNVLREPVTFAMISSKRLHKIFQFPLFLDMGQINCDLLVNYEEMVLSETEISDIKACHFALFKKVTKTLKSAQVFDNRNKEHSFFIAPVKKNEEGRFVLDWDLIRSDYCRNSMSALVRYNPTASRGSKVTVKKARYDETWSSDVTSTSLVPYDGINGRLLWGVSQDKEDSTPRFTMTEADYRFFILIPNYRNRDLPQCYIVDRFCRDMTPLSEFPTEHYDNFVSYYKDKYEIEITNTRQPLLKVSPLYNCSNFNKPRNRKLRRAKEKYKEHDELLLPELCDVVPFDRKFWVKALLLPTVLNRICHVYLVEEFRRRITSEMGLGVIELPEGKDWKPLQVDDACTEKEEEEGVASDLSLASWNTSLPLSKLKDKTQSRSKVFLDPERHLYECGLCDLEFYVRGLLEMDDDEFQGVQTFKENFEVLNMMKIDQIPTLNILKGGTSGLGPDLALLVQAFTSKSANDIVNYERLEILGDSFLKFGTTLFLFRNYEHHEGVLTNVKGKLVGNRNLLYCGLAKNIQDVINVTDFVPLSDWNPPLLTVPERLGEIILASNVDPAVLYRLEIEEEEQFSGVLSESTLRKNEKILNEYEKCCEIPSNSLLPYKTVSDKTISDCVEALLGAYLLSSGIYGALEFLCWLEVLPASCSFRELMGKPYVGRVLNSNEKYAVLNTLQQVFYTDLEDVLSYRFQNKALLLEALTHPSYSTTRITNCYQRLEFLGDAVLDFLVTTYIYENCGNLTPGQVTDIRSSLVNNITFACIVVRYELYKYMLSFSSGLSKAIENFVSFQARRDHVVDENVLTLLDESDCLIAEAVQVPKALGDIFESLAGAIFLDSGNSLSAVWNVFYKLMKREIDEFTKTIPKTSVRLLSEICGDKPYYETQVLKGVTKVSCSIYFNNREIKAHGFGVNKKEGKRSAAKLLLSKILDMKK